MKNKQEKQKLEEILRDNGIVVGKKLRKDPCGSQLVTIEDILVSGDFVATKILNYAFSRNRGYPSSNYSIIIANLADKSASRVFEHCAHEDYAVPKLTHLKVDGSINIKWEMVNCWGDGKVTSESEVELVYRDGKFARVISEPLIAEYERMEFYP